MTDVRDNPNGWSILAIVAMAAAVLAPPLGIVLGVVALLRARTTHLRGGGLAITAIVVGAAMCVLTIVSVWAWMSFTVDYTTTIQTV